MTRHSIIIGAAALCGMLPWEMPAQARIQGEVTSFGEVVAEREEPAVKTEQDRSLSGRMTIFGRRFISQTAALTGQMCLRFGVEIQLTADRGDVLPPEVTVVITHPLLTRPDRVSGTEERFSTPVIRTTAFAGWTFDHDWELRPGLWTFAFVSGEEVLASQTFTIDAKPGSICAPDRIS